MLDQNIINQLKEVFGALESKITFCLRESDHEKQKELKEMLIAVAETSDKLEVKETGTSPTPYFSILKDDMETGIEIKAIPGGHEFTSLILAILNTDGKGKLPDSGIQDRIARLQNNGGKIQLRTYISLSCTNCPEVVQALNIISLFNDNVSHTMVDGSLCEAEVGKLGIQGVPTVVTGENQIIHVGKSSLAELLENLEEEYGSNERAVSSEAKEYDVVVIGGGPAGASAAIYSARKGLKTAIVAEKIGGQVNETKGIENLISTTYTEGPQLAANLDKHIREYDIDVLENRKVEQIESEVGAKLKSIFMKGGELVTTPSLIIATGAKWRELGIPGENEYKGRGVAFCPHCDGPFYKDKRVAVIGGGNSGIEAAIDLAGICSHVTVLEFMETLKADEVLINNLKALPNVDVIVNARTSEVVGNDEKVTGIKYQNREYETDHQIDIDGIFVQIGLAPNSSIVKDIVDTNRYGEIIVDDKCRTSEAGIYAAGDVTTVPYKQIIISMGEGAKAALTAFDDRIRK